MQHFVCFILQAQPMNWSFSGSLRKDALLVSCSKFFLLKRKSVWVWKCDFIRDLTGCAELESLAQR